MSSWGNLDNVTIAGTVVVATANGAAVLGVNTEFTSNVKPGDYIIIAGNKYQVATVDSDTSLTLTNNAATTSAGVAAYVQQGPKYISNVIFDNRATNLYTIQNIFGVDVTEMTPNIVVGLSLLNTTLVSSATITQPGNYILDSQTNTIITITTTGAVQPTENALATPTFTSNALTGVTITREGVGYTSAVQANTTATVTTLGVFQPTVNANISLNYTSGQVTGLGYDVNAQANTTVTISTSGAVQPTANATATLSYSGGRIAGFTVVNRGTGYTSGAKANTVATISTSGAIQPTGNGQATVDFSTEGSGSLANTSHTGWVSATPTYTDGLGQVRNKFEVLVAMSKNFNKDSAGALQQDASDDTKYPE